MDALLLGHMYGQQGNELQGLNNIIVPFVACGDLNGFDADKSYPLQLTPLARSSSNVLPTATETEQDKDQEETYRYVYREPVCPPINPNHADSEKQKKQKNSGSSSSRPSSLQKSGSSKKVVIDI